MTRSLTERVAPAAAFQFCFIAAVAMLKPGANALTLSRFNASALPWLYVMAALIAGGLAVAPTRRWRQPGRIALAGAVLAVALAVGVKLALPFVALIAYLFSEAFATQVSLAFWGSMGEAFDSREARRAFSWVNGIGMTGAIAGGFIAQLLARTAGALALLLGGAVMLGLAFVAWRFHRVDAPPEPRGTRDNPLPSAGWREVLASPYAQLLGTVVLGLAAMQQLIDFIFRDRVASRLLEADMADLFAAHQLWTGVFCVVFQFVLAEVLLRRLGILRYAALVPVAIGALTLVAWAVPSIWSAWALKVLEAAATWSLMPVAIQLLYAPLPDELRDGARRTIDGVVRKGGMGLAGVVLLGLPLLGGLHAVFLATILTCAGVVLALWRIRPRYVEAVHARVAGLESGRTFEGQERILAEALKSGSVEQALRAADLLERTELLKEEHVRLMLLHPSETVQTRGVFFAQELGASGVSRLLEELISRGARRPRDSAIWALARVSPERAAVVLPTLLDQKDIGVRTAAIGGLMSLPGPDDPRARELLEGLLSRGPVAPAAERREVARLLGRAHRPELSAALGRYLEDTEVSVRRVAIEAAGQGGYVELAPRLLRFLSWRDERREARHALAQLGDAVVPLLASTMDDRTRTRSLRLQLPRLLRLIATQAALDALLFSNAHDEPFLHYRVGLALAQLHDEHPELQIDEQRQLEALGRRRALSLAYVEPYRDARAALGEDALLTRVLGDRLDQSMEIAFWLLGLRHDPRGMRRAYTQLLGADLRRRAWAVEWLENVLSADERELTQDFVDAHHRALPFGAAARFPEALDAMCTADDLVLKTCARVVARGMGRWPLKFKEDEMNATTVKKLFALEGVEIFAQSDVDDLAAIAAVAREQHFAAGARVYAEGDPGDALYVIVEGTMEARREGETVLTMKARESFGETSLFDGAPRINEVIATSASRTLVIDRRDFLDLLADRPELLTGMFRVLSRQLKSMVVEVTSRRSSSSELPAVGGPPVR